jgi:hypothetical protein
MKVSTIARTTVFLWILAVSNVLSASNNNQQIDNNTSKLKGSNPVNIDNNERKLAKTNSDKHTDAPTSPPSTIVSR